MDDVELLKRVPLFAKMTNEEIVELRGVMDLCTFPPGQVILREGEPGDYFYVVRKGRVQYLICDAAGKELILDDAEAGEFFGELSMITGEPRYATVRSLDEVELLGLSHTVFFDTLQDHPHAAMELLSIIGRRLHRTDRLLRQTVSRNVNEIVEENSTFGQRIADGFAAVMGSWTFIIVQSALLAFWVGWNLIAPRFNWWYWDPYPFIFLNLALSFQAAYAAPIIMMSQNRAGDKDRLAAEIDHEVNMKAEVKTGLILSRLDELERLMNRMMRDKHAA